MEIRPHETDQEKVIVKIEDLVDDRLAMDEYPDFWGEVEIDGLHYSLDGRQHKYPFEVEISRRGLGRIAGRALISDTDSGMITAKKIYDHFELEERPHRRVI